MNFSTVHRLDITGHRDIDFVDIRLETDTALYVDPERISLSGHPFGDAAAWHIDDFFNSLCDAALNRDDLAVYKMLSFGREPNETHLGLSSLRSQGRGTSPEILMPIVNDMIRLGLFERELVTQLGDLHLWTPNFGFDRLSDLTTNIIREVLYDYTLEQYRVWDIPVLECGRAIAATWDPVMHQWANMQFPRLVTDGYQNLLVPKAFVGRNMLSSPGTLLQKYALRYRQREHLDERSELCHRKTDRDGNERWTPPTKKELRDFEVKGHSEKAYLLQMGQRYPRMVNELHVDNRGPNLRAARTMSDRELDAILYGNDEIAV